jgi:hypothetical protein
MSNLLKQAGVDLNNWSYYQSQGLAMKAATEKDVKTKSFKLASGQILKLSYDEVANLLRVIRDPEGKEALLKGGLKRKQNRTTKAYYKLTESDLVGIMANTPYEIKKFAFMVGDSWFNDYERNRLNEISNRVTGFDIADEGANYTHLKRDGDDAVVAEGEYSSARDILARNAHTSLKHGSLKQRTGGKTAIVIEGMMESMVRSLHEHSVYAGYGEIFPKVESATKIIASKLNDVGAEVFADKLEKKINSMFTGTSGNFVEKFMGKVRSAFVVGNLGWRPATALMQAFSGMLYMAEVEDSGLRHNLMLKYPMIAAKTIADLVKNKFNINKAYDEMINTSVEMRNRFDTGFSSDLTENTTHSEMKKILATVTNNNSKVAKVLNALTPDQSMMAIRAFDAAAMQQGWELAKLEVEATGANPVGSPEYWRDVVDTHNNYVRKTQPTSDEFDNTAVQDAPGLKHVIMFATARAKQWQMLRKAMVNGATKKGIARALETALLLFGMQALTEATKEMFKQMEGEGEDEDKIAKTLAVKTATGTLSNWLLVGEGLNTLLIPFLNKQAGTNVPVGRNEMYIWNYFTDMKRFAKAKEDGDTEKMVDAATSMLSNVGIPAEGAKTYIDIIRNVAKEE